MVNVITLFANDIIIICTTTGDNGQAVDLPIEVKRCQA